MILQVLTGIAAALLVAWLLVMAALAIRRRRGKTAQLAAAYRRFSPSGAASTGTNSRLRTELLVLAALVLVNVVCFGLLLSQSGDERAVPSTSAQTETPGRPSPSSTPSPSSDPMNRQQLILLEKPPVSAQPFQAVRIQGRYRDGANTFLQVQRWEDGQWVAFPVPTKTDKDGRFTAHLELGEPGRYQLRLQDPASGVTSKPFVLVIGS